MKAIVTQFALKRRNEPDSEKWEGLAELDRALAEKPLTEYCWDNGSELF